MGKFGQAMKIVDIAEFYAPEGGGVRTYMHQKMRAAKDAGHELTVIAPGARTRLEETPDGRIWWVKAFQLPMDKRYYLFTGGKDAHRILDQEKPDILEASSTWRGAWIAAQWRGKALKSLVLHQEPVMVYPHTFLGKLMPTRHVDSLFGWFWWYLRALGGRFDTSIVSGDWMASRYAGFGIERPAVVPFGVDKSDFGPSRRDEALRADLLRQMGLDPAKARLLINVSRHHPEKRLKTVFSAVKQVSQSAPVGLIQVGSGPFTGQVTRLAQNNSNIHLTGYIKDRDYLARLMASADAMLHGSAAETFGLVIAEGLCSGLPIICPNAGGAYDMSGEAYSEVYAAGDPAAAAQAIRNLFTRDHTALTRAAVHAAQTRIVSHDVHFSRLFDHYQALLGHREPAAGTGEPLAAVA